MFTMKRTIVSIINYLFYTFFLIQSHYHIDGKLIQSNHHFKTEYETTLIMRIISFEIVLFFCKVQSLLPAVVNNDGNHHNHSKTGQQEVVQPPTNEGPLSQAPGTTLLSQGDHRG